MKRSVAFAVLALTAALTLARADEGAYVSLVGMARSAAHDRGPDAGDAPAHGRPEREARPAVAAPAVRTPRVWTRLYAALMPSWGRVPFLANADGFETASSTSAVRVPPVAAPVPPPDAEAVRAGERRGLAELLSAAVVPAEPR
ncbi:MAG: hypothetical protein KGL74_14795 [Elusimicrobia bacterium]|nr:hypothetical protein [Elusimicrobiota bacterium]MDE2512391.1 hypothetical protein [Elusimicrobiota bacterium]